jgi:hypothetical protein
MYPAPQRPTSDAHSARHARPPGLDVTRCADDDESARRDARRPRGACHRNAACRRISKPRLASRSLRAGNGGGLREQLGAGSGDALGDDGALRGATARDALGHWRGARGPPGWHHPHARREARRVGTGAADRLGPARCAGDEADENARAGCRIGSGARAYGSAGGEGRDIVGSRRYRSAGSRRYRSAGSRRYRSAGSRRYRSGPNRSQREPCRQAPSFVGARAHATASRRQLAGYCWSRSHAGAGDTTSRRSRGADARTPRAGSQDDAARA